ncbi:MAG TPA: GNAT family N-acetyltransferase [Holophagaceae bacterium]|nr:GNAT family N-acetyltransferase [Holophagaceae bacterium]
MADFRVRSRILDDIPAIPALMRRVYPAPLHGPEAIWGEQNLLRHLAQFGAGQFVAEASDGTVIGTATSMRLDLAQALAPHTWAEITGSGSLSTHVPGGAAMYGVNIAVDPVWQNRGVGQAMYAARLDLARTLGCKAFVAGARIPGYAGAADRLSPEEYIAEVAAGRRMDPTLTKQMAVGFVVKGLLRDYAPDPETQGHAALIVLWL